MPPDDPIVIIGAGHAGVQVAASLRDEGVSNSIVLVNGEGALPYERPPLSKKLLDGSVGASGILLRDADFYRSNAIDLISDQQVTSIDRLSKKVTIGSASQLGYSHLVFATGCGRRELDHRFDEVEGVYGLRSLADAIDMRSALDQSQSIVIIGAGFIGMECGSIAARRGCKVNIVEAAARPLGRSSTSVSSDYLRAQCESSGVRFHFNEIVTDIDRDGRKLKGVWLSDRYLTAEMLLICVGAVPRDQLAKECGLSCPNGIEVDEMLSTGDTNVSAVGDCTWHPNLFAGRMMRLECVQNAHDQARIVASKLAKKTAKYESVPSFWSDIGKNRLQIAGFMHDCDRHIVRGNIEDGKFSVFGFKGDTLKGVESVNRPADSVLARRALSWREIIRPSDVEDEKFELKDLLNARAGG